MVIYRFHVYRRKNRNEGLPSEYQLVKHSIGSDHVMIAELYNMLTQPESIYRINLTGIVHLQPEQLISFTRCNTEVQYQATTIYNPKG